MDVLSSHYNGMLVQFVPHHSKASITLPTPLTHSMHVRILREKRVPVLLRSLNAWSERSQAQQSKDDI
jgi:hypothetical protein